MRGRAALLGADDVALSILAEVASLYPGRGVGGADEALVNAGSLALGREPCGDMGSPPGQDYSGWGVVTPWRVDGSVVPGPEFPSGSRRVAGRAHKPGAWHPSVETARGKAGGGGTPERGPEASCLAQPRVHRWRRLRLVFRCGQQAGRQGGRDRGRLGEMEGVVKLVFLSLHCST